jgi:hypothetical protein
MSAHSFLDLIRGVSFAFFPFAFYSLKERERERERGIKERWLSLFS